MSFTVPEFPLDCNIWRNSHRWKLDPPDVESECNLAYGRRVSSSANDALENNQAGVLMMLLLPPLTDIRDLKCAAVEDLVEVPAGSGRIYRVCDVDDIGKGFPNEHRCALIVGVSNTRAPFFVPAGSDWPAPIP